MNKIVKKMSIFEILNKFYMGEHLLKKEKNNRKKKKNSDKRTT